MSLAVTMYNPVCVRRLSKCAGGPGREPEKQKQDGQLRPGAGDAKGLADSCRVSQAGQGAGGKGGAGDWEVACCPLSQG